MKNKFDIFKCPFFGECNEAEERAQYYYDNEVNKIFQVSECKMPFLVFKMSGEPICRLIFDPDMPGADLNKYAETIREQVRIFSGDIMTNSKQKGKRGELELAKILREYGFNARRTAQYNGKETGSLADIVGLPGVHAEVKRVQSGFSAIQNAMAQAIRDSAGTAKTPVVFHRQNRSPWLVTMRLEDWLARYGAAETEGENAEKK